MKNHEQYSFDIENTNIGEAKAATSSLAYWGADTWKSMLSSVNSWFRNRDRRRAFRYLLRLDEKMLLDIGVTREELLRVEAMPLSVNAAEELRRMALQRRRDEQAGKIPR